MKSLLLTLLLALSASAANFSVGWDPRPASEGVTGYKLWSLATTTNLLAATTASQVSITLPDGAYRLAATSTNAVGESDFSLPLFVVVTGTNVVAVSNRPGAPLNLQLR